MNGWARSSHLLSLPDKQVLGQMENLSRIVLLNVH